MRLLLPAITTNASVYFGLLFIFLTACDAPVGHTLVVSLQTDLVAGHEFTEAELTMLPIDGRGDTQRIINDSQPDTFVSMEVLDELEDLESDAYRLRLTLLDANGLGLTVRPVLVDLDANTAVSIRITRSCLEVACGDEEACLDGQCVDFRCSEESPEYCDRPSTCGSNADCSAGAPCAEGVCEEGICWARTAAVGAPNSCGGEKLWCHPESGCTAVGTAAAMPSCDDGQRNGFEEGIDCGGPCERCTGLWRSVVTDECLDALQGPNEEGIDCGGSCTACPDDDFCSTQSDVPAHECLALYALYRASPEAEWTRARGWFADEDICRWDGIACDNGHVSELVDPTTALTGKVPPELANLRSLREFRLSARLTGTIPPELALLSELTSLDLSDNNIDGTIPPELGQLSKLQYLYLGPNELEGTIPQELGQLASLWSLDLAGNLLGGTIPSTLGNLRELYELNLASNDIEGELPESLGQLAQMELFFASDNKLTGSIPATFGGMTSMTDLRLQRNTLTGPIPASLGTLPLFVVKLNENQLRGAVPATFASFTSNPGSADLTFQGNSCLWTEDCRVQELFDDINPTWQSSNHAEDCSPPPLSCP